MGTATSENKGRIKDVLGQVVAHSHLCIFVDRIVKRVSQASIDIPRETVQVYPPKFTG